MWRKTKKSVSIDEELMSLMKWHATTGERLVRTALYDPIRAITSLKNISTSTKRSMPFVIAVKRTYEVIEPENKKHHKTSKGFASGDGTQPRIAIVFWGGDILMKNLLLKHKGSSIGKLTRGQLYRYNLFRGLG